MTDNSDNTTPATTNMGTADTTGGRFGDLPYTGLTVLDQLPVPCFLIDTKGGFAAGNSAFYLLTGLESDHLLGKSFYQLLAAHLQDGLMADDRALLEGEEVAPVLVSLASEGGGTTLTMVLKKTRAIDSTGSVVGVLVTVERPESADLKAALQQSEHEKQAILDGFPGVLCLLSPDERIIWVNQKVLEIHDDPVGRKCHEVFCGNSGQCVKCALSQPWGEGSAGSSVRRFGIGLSGEEAVYEISGMPVTNDEGETTAMLLIGWDVSDRFKLEKQLRHSQKMEAIGTLAGGIAHDFNNVLTPIIGYSEIIRLKLMQEESLDQTVQDYLDGIMRAARRAKKLVEQVLTFSRSSEQKESLQYLHPIVKEVMKLMRVSLPSTVAIKEEVDEGCGMVMVDPVQIHQVMINLCSNSSEAMAGSHGTLTVALSRVEPDSDGEEWLKLSVADTGSGISPEDLERIFDPYFSTKEKSQGTGMGLAMVHGIIKRQGGRVEVESTLGEGTTFTIFLPVAGKAANQESQTSVVDLIRGTGHILLVDDEAQVVQVTSELLSSLGYKVTGRTSAYDALALFLQNPSGYDLLLTDLTMPELTGLELCEKIKAIRKDLPVVLFTGYSERLPKEAGEKAGVDQYCMKPASMRELSSVVHSTIYRTV